MYPKFKNQKSKIQDYRTQLAHTSIFTQSYHAQKGSFTGAKIKH